MTNQKSQIKIVGRFDVSVNTTIEKIGHQINKLNKEYDSLLKNIKDVWTPLGKGAPLLREAFNGVQLPINNKEQLIDEMGGKDRLIIAPSLDGSMTVVSVLDMVEDLSLILDNFLPLNDWESLARNIIKWQINARRKNDKSVYLLHKIGDKHLRSLLKDTDRARRVLPQNKREFSEAFEIRKPLHKQMTKKPENGAYNLFFSNITFVRATQAKLTGIAALDHYIDHMARAMIEISEIFEAMWRYWEERREEEEQKEIVFAQTSSAITYLTTAEENINEASSNLDNVLLSNNITSEVLEYNNDAYNREDSASQLILRGLGALALAEAAAKKIPGNAEAQNAVAEAQGKLEDVQRQADNLITKMGDAERHKDILSIPMVCVTIQCIDVDWCCSQYWNNTNVCIQNSSNLDVPEVCGTTSGNGNVTLCGRFGNSSIIVTTSGPSGWNETKMYYIGTMPVSYVIQGDYA